VCYVQLACPVLSVEVTVTDGLGQVRRLYGWASFQIGNGTGYFEYAVVGAGRQVQPVHGVLE